MLSGSCKWKQGVPFLLLVLFLCSSSTTVHGVLPPHSPACLQSFTSSLARDFYVIERQNKGQDGLLHPPRLQAPEFMGPSHLHEINHYIFGGQRDWTQAFKALFIYRGTGGHGALMLLSQLISVGCPYKLIVSSPSYAEIMEAHGLIHAWALEHLTNYNVEFHYGPPSGQLSTGSGTFDYIDISDIHRIEQSEQELLETLKLVAQLLKPGGGMGMAVKSTSFALGTTQLLLNNPSMDKGLLEQLSAIAVDDPTLKSSPGNATRLLRDTVTRLYTLRHPRGYSVSEITALLTEAGLQSVGLVGAALYEPGLSTGANSSTTESKAEKLCFDEGLEQSGSPRFHEFFAVKPQYDHSSSVTPLKLSPEAVPVLRNREAAGQLIRQEEQHQQQQVIETEAASSSTLPGPRIPFVIAPDLSPVYLPPPPPRPAGGSSSVYLFTLILDLTDGTRNMRSIHAHLVDQYTPHLNWADYWVQVEWLYHVLHGLGWMVLSAGTPPPFKAVPPHMRREPIHKEPPPLPISHDSTASRPRLARAPCSPPHCYFTCYDPPRGQPPLNCQAPAFDWPSMVRGGGLIKQCTTPDGLPYQIYPISFGIPKEDIVDCVPRKVRDFGTVVPGKKDTYIFTPLHEAEYKRDYRMAYYSKTTRKAGWDCLRHYEILASGAVPYFTLLEDCPQDIMTSLPKDLLLTARELAGVTANGIDKTVFNQTQYHELACQLLDHTHKHLTTEALAKYVLEVTGNAQAKRILYLGYGQDTDYLSDNLLHGLVKYLMPQGGVVTDIPKVQHNYHYPDNHPVMTAETLYGHGFSYAHRLADDPTVDRTRIVERIKAREFDLVIYASVHRGLLYWKEVTESYGPDSVIYIDGEDYYHAWTWLTNRAYFVLGTGHYFKREMHPGCPPPPESTAAVTA